MKNILMVATGIAFAPFVFGGSFFYSAGEPERITHPPGYAGIGIALSLEICLDDEIAKRDAFEYLLSRIARTWNESKPELENITFAGVQIHGGVDAETVLLHEVGHCIGLGHPDQADSGGYAASDMGSDLVFSFDAGADGVAGSSDDQRGDDINRFWFRKIDNNPFASDAQPSDPSMFSLNTSSDLPGNHDYAAIPSSEVALEMNYGLTESVMMSSIPPGRAVRELCADDVATLGIAQAGVDQVRGTADDYSVSLSVGSADIICDLLFTVEPIGSLGRCNPGSFEHLGGSHYALARGATILLNLRENWYFNIPFSDLEEEDWFNLFAKYVAENGVMIGFPQQDSLERRFQASDFATRAETLKLAYEGSQELIDPTVSDPGFSDVGIDDWHFRFVADAAAKGYVEGRPCGAQLCFEPDSPVSRYEAAKIVHAVFESVDYRNISGKCSSGDYSGTFRDVDAGDWFCEATEWLVSTNVTWTVGPGQSWRTSIASGYNIHGQGRYFGGDILEDGVLQEVRNLNRGELSVIIANAMNQIGGGSDVLPYDPPMSTPLADFPQSTKGSGFYDLGNIYEQVDDPANLTFPASISVPGGNTQIVSDSFAFRLETEDSDGDKLFYYWSADGGTFTTTDPVNYSSVTWHPPSVSQDTTFTISAVRGDRRGKVGRGIFYFTVPADGSGSNSPASGSLTSPSGTQSGTVTVTASATDADGLERVYATFAAGGAEVELCSSSGPSTCSGTSDSFSRSGIDPASYGAAVGSVTVRLFVEDALGEVAQVAQRTFTYDPPTQGPSFNLTIVKQGPGDGTVTGGGINCGPGCTTQTVQVSEGEQVTLTAAPDSASIFVGFAGDRCIGNGVCSFTMLRDVEQVVSFGEPDSLKVLYTTPSSGDESLANHLIFYMDRKVNPGPTFSDCTIVNSSGTTVASHPMIHENTSQPRRRVLLLADESLQRGETYTATLPAGAVVDDDGNPLSTPTVVQWTRPVQDAPQMYLGAYSPWTAENDRIQVDVFFEEPAEADREISLTSDPPGLLEHISYLFLPEGEVHVQEIIDVAVDHGDIENHGVVLSASADGYGQVSEQIFIGNLTSSYSLSGVRYLTEQLVDDDDGDGLFEAGEDAHVEFHVTNSSSSGEYVVLHFQVLNADRSLEFPGSWSERPRCDVAYLNPGQSGSCTLRLRADAELPSDRYYIEVEGTRQSGARLFLDQASLSLTNNAEPDYYVSMNALPSWERPPGSVYEVYVHPRNRGDGFSAEMIPFEVIVEVEGQEQVLHRLVTDARGYVFNTRSMKLPIVWPSVPGEHRVWVRVNPPGPDQLPESDYTNNVSSVRTIRVEEPNVAPVLEPLGGPFSVSSGETFTLTVNATDDNNDSLDFSLGGGAPAGMVIGTTGTIVWTPECGQEGTWSFDIIVSDDDGASDSETMTIVVGRRTDVALELNAPPEALPGTTVQWTLTASNLGPSCLDQAQVTQSLPPTLLNASWTCAPSPEAGCGGAGTGAVTDTASLPAGGTVTYTVTTVIAPEATGSVSSTAMAAVTGSASDPNSSNNAASATVTLRPLDFGDAPNSALGSQWSFPTQLTEDGARHGFDATLFLGSLLDVEPDGQPTLAADGDDLGATDDDDGVEILGELQPCSTADIEVTVSQTALLDAWVDFNTDGSWDVAEQILVSAPVQAGLNALSFSVPCNATPAALAFARFRVSRSGGLQPFGLALDGEVEDHGFLVAQVFRDLEVSRTGSGDGSVVAAPSGIQCGADCSEAYPIGSIVVLSANPAYGSAFSGWSGTDCTGQGTCVLTMDQDRAATATFDLVEFDLTVARTGSGMGEVTSSPAGIACGATCTQSFLFGTTVTLTATADSNSTFTGWSGGGCSGTGSCTLPIEAATTVGANFELRSYPLSVTKAGEGSGVVTSTPAGISCGDNCSAGFTHGTTVMLTASAAEGSVFMGWSGAGCSGTAACAVTMDAAATVTATFDLQEHALTLTLAGEGSGTVTSVPSGIDCPTTCSSVFDYGSEITLTAAPEPGSVFTGWDDPSCPGTSACTTTIVEATALTATFEPDLYRLDLAFLGTGSGSVALDVSGVQCSADCVEEFVAGTTVTLTASPSTGSAFAGWSGACTGTAPCVLLMDQNRSVEVEFDLESYALTIERTGSGTGTVTSTPAGVDCGSDCEQSFLYGTLVTLDAHAGMGSAFGGWTGGSCTVASSCALTIDQDLAISAHFDPTCLDGIESGDSNWHTAAGPNDGGASLSWHIVNDSSHGGVQSWFVAEEDIVKDQLLVGAFSVPASAVGTLLRFWHRHDTELGSDGGVLEYSVDGGSSWFDILAGNGSTIPANTGRFLGGGYSGNLGDCCSNPLANRGAWTGTTDWQETTVDLGDFSGQSILFRWRFGADDAVAEGQGWWIDDVAILDAWICPFGVLFYDGFESGTTQLWSNP